MLEASVEKWKFCQKPVASVVIMPFAVSRSSCEEAVREPSEFGVRFGDTTLERSSEAIGYAGANIAVQTSHFDDWSRDIGQIKLVKIEVESNENSALDGMEGALSQERIDHLVFWKIRALSSPTVERLTRFGCQCHMIDRSFWRPKLIPDRERPESLSSKATKSVAKDSSNVEDLPPAGWSCLS